MAVIAKAVFEFKSQRARYGIESGDCSMSEYKITHLEGKDNAYAKKPVKSFMASLWEMLARIKSRSGIAAYGRVVEWFMTAVLKTADV